MRFKNRFNFFKRLNAKRSLAYCVDVVVITICSTLLANLFAFSLLRLSSIGFTISFEHWSNASYFNHMLVYTSYFFFSFYLFEGQTYGMKLFKIQVKCAGFNQQSLSLNNALRRSMANYVSHQLYFIPFAIVFFNDTNQNLPDLSSNSQISYFSNSQKVEMKNELHQRNLAA